MGESHSMELVERAEQLYCVEGHTFEQVATLTGVAASTLKRWSERYGWQESKEKIRQALASIRSNTILLRARLIENCMTTMNAQDAFAVSALESTAMRAAELASKNAASVVPPVESIREIKTDEDAVAALEEAVAMKLNAMLTNPAGVSFAAVNDVKKALDLVKSLKAGVKPEDSGKRTIDAQTIKDLRKQLGL